MPHTTCWTMIEGAAAGNDVARSEFARRYLSVVRAYLAARWAGSGGGRDLEDAVQEVFLECLREGGVLARARREEGSGFRAYLLGASRNVARRFEGGRWRRPEESGGHAFDGDELPDEESLTRIFDRAWASSILREALERVSAEAESGDAARRRRVKLLRLRYHDGLALVDIARRWDEEPARLYRDHERALAEFEQSLRATVAMHHPHTPERVGEECRELLEMIR